MHRRLESGPARKLLGYLWGRGRDLGLEGLPVHVENVIARLDAEIQDAHGWIIDLDGEPWVLAVADAKARLLRFGSDGDLEIRFLGELHQGDYSEVLGYEGATKTIRLSFTHDRLPGGQIEVEGQGTGEAITRLRATLRAWADAPSTAKPH